MITRLTLTDLAKLSNLVSMEIKTQPQNSTDGLEELSLKFKELLTDGRSSSYCVTINPNK
tara:strand:- start:499 stop:678 length:180 start_codon:yes stop_codon:yes gene_type:complete